MVKPPPPPPTPPPVTVQTEGPDIFSAAILALAPVAFVVFIVLWATGVIR